MCLYHKTKNIHHTPKCPMPLLTPVAIPIIIFAHKNIQNYSKPPQNCFISSASVQFNICGGYCDWFTRDIFPPPFRIPHATAQSGKQTLHFPNSLALGFCVG